MIKNLVFILVVPSEKRKTDWTTSSIFLSFSQKKSKAPSSAFSFQLLNANLILHLLVQVQVSKELSFQRNFSKLANKHLRLYYYLKNRWVELSRFCYCCWWSNSKFILWFWGSKKVFLHFYFLLLKVSSSNLWHSQQACPEVLYS